MRAPTFFLAPLALLLTACSQSEVGANAALKSAYSALNEDNHKEALAEFDGALTALESSDELYLDAKLGQIKALAHLDPVMAQSALESLTGDSRITAQDYRIIVGELTQAAKAHVARGNKDFGDSTMEVAAAILDDGSKAFPDYKGWSALIQGTGKLAEDLGSPAALKNLEGLGYLGSDDPAN